MVKQFIMQSRIYANYVGGYGVSAKVVGEQWEKHILARVKYSLGRVKIDAAANMMDGGGRLLVTH
jgi:hypothetical protein